MFVSEEQHLAVFALGAIAVLFLAVPVCVFAPQLLAEGTPAGKGTAQAVASPADAIRCAFELLSLDTIGTDSGAADSLPHAEYMGGEALSEMIGGSTKDVDSAWVVSVPEIALDFDTTDDKVHRVHKPREYRVIVEPREGRILRIDGVSKSADTAWLSAARNSTTQGLLREHWDELVGYAKPEDIVSLSVAFPSAHLADPWETDVVSWFPLVIDRGDGPMDCWLIVSFGVMIQGFHGEPDRPGRMQCLVDGKSGRLIEARSATARR